MFWIIHSHAQTKFHTKVVSLTGTGTSSVFKILLMPQTRGLTMYTKHSNNPNGGNLSKHPQTTDSQKNHHFFSIIVAVKMVLEIM
jgi:hypothetical protein